MADLIFRCPACTKCLCVDAVAAGALCACLACGEQVPVPAPVLEFRCPFCNTPLLAPDGMGEELFECPACEVGIPVPHLLDG